jgi:hypothetical protein
MCVYVFVCAHVDTFVGLAQTIYIRCIHGDSSREITNYMVIYGAYIRFWPTLHMCVSVAMELGIVQNGRHEVQGSNCGLGGR